MQIPAHQNCVLKTAWSSHMRKQRLLILPNSQHPIQHQRDFLEIIQAVYPEEIWIGMIRIWSIIYICYFFTSKFIALITSTNSY